MSYDTSYEEKCDIILAWAKKYNANNPRNKHFNTGFIDSVLDHANTVNKKGECLGFTDAQMEAIDNIIDRWNISLDDEDDYEEQEEEDACGVCNGSGYMETDDIEIPCPGCSLE